MYSSSSSSSQQQPNSNNNNTNLLRYDSAPSSFFTNAVDSVAETGHDRSHHQHQFFDTDVLLNAPPESSTMTSDHNQSNCKNTLSLLRSYGLPETDRDGMNINATAPPPPPPSSSTSNLIRHSSSPAGFLSHLTTEIGFSISKGIENFNPQGNSGHSKLSRLGTQMSFTKQEHHHSLAQIAEVNECCFEGMSMTSHHDHNKRSSLQSQSQSGFSLSPWDDSGSSSGSHNIVFSGKRPKNITDDILNGLASIDSQAALDLATMDRLLHIPQDSVPCKIRAKRGFATHPRSIAERERRTRINGKLKKLQDLVPNMDKQTSYSDMLDLAVQHIKGLQSQIQKLNQDLENCTCGCKEGMHS